MRSFVMRKRRKVNGYRTRSFALRQIGFQTYQEYLLSDLWRKIREAVLERDNRICRACGRRAVQVHHRSYGTKVLLGLDLGPLWSVCGDCHGWAERAGNGSKRSLETANQRLDKRAQALERKRSKSYGSTWEPEALSG